MIKNLIVPMLVMVGVIAFASPAAFAQTTNVSTEGPNSPVEVSVENENNNTCEVDNNVSVSNDNNQNSQSGNSSSGNNTTSGNTTSGNASADNDTEIDADISNDCCAESCCDSDDVNGCHEEEVEETPEEDTPVVETTSTPPTSTPQVLAASTVKALPDTGSSVLKGFVAMSAAVAGAALISKVGATVVSRRFN